MVVIKFWIDDLFYAYSGETAEKAREGFEEGGYGSLGEVTKTEEVPESEWDEMKIDMYEDNDVSKEPFKVSIRDQMIGSGPDLIYTNDEDLMN